MGLTELERMIRRVAEVIRAETGIPKVRPGRHEIWLTFVRRSGRAEERVMPARRIEQSVMTGPELIDAVAESIVLSVFGDEVQVVPHVPNLHLRLLDRQATVHMPGAPPPDEDGQVWLRVAVRRSEPGLLERMFWRRANPG